MTRMSRRFIFIFAQFIQAIGTYLVIRIMIDNVSLEIYGTFALILVPLAFVQQVLLGSLSVVVQRQYLNYYPEHKNLILDKTFLHSVAYLIVTALIATYVCSTLDLTLKNELLVWLFAFIHPVSASLYANLNQFLSLSKKFKWASMILFLEILLKLTIAILGFKFSKNEIAILCLVYFIPYLVLVCLQYSILHRPFNETSSRVVFPKFKTYFLTYFPLVYGNFVFWIQQSSERLITGLYIGRTELGQLVALQQLGFAPILLLGSIGIRLMQPFWYDEKISQNQSFFRLLCLLGIIIAFTVIIFIYVIVTDGFLLLPIGLQPLKRYYLLMIVAGSAMAVGELLAAYFVKLEDYKILTFCKAIVGISWISSVWVGAYFWAFDGIVYGILFGTLLYAAVMFTICIIYQYSFIESSLFMQTNFQKLLQKKKT